MSRIALFLDRDGVINVDHGYVYKVDDFEFVDGIFELVTAAKKADYLVVVVTNQAGIGRGYYTEEEFIELSTWVKEKFEEKGGTIDKFYFCPFHPEHGIGKFRRSSNMRKPAPGMLLLAQKELDIDLNRSIFVGDKLSDMAAGRAAGIGKLFKLGDLSLSDDFVHIKKLSDILPYI